MSFLVSTLTNEIFIESSPDEDEVATQWDEGEPGSDDKVDYRYTLIDGSYHIPNFYEWSWYCNQQELTWDDPIGFDVSAHNILLKGKKLLRLYELSCSISEACQPSDDNKMYLYLFEDGSHEAHDVHNYKNIGKDQVVASVTNFDFLDSFTLKHGEDYEGIYYQVVGFTSTSVIISFTIDRSQCDLHPYLIPLIGPREKFVNDLEEDTIVVFDLSAPFIYHSYNEIPSRSGCFVDQTMGKKDYVHLRDIVARHFSVDDIYERFDDDESVYEEEIKEDIVEMIDYLHRREDFELLYQLFAEATTEGKESFQMHAHLRHDEVNLQDLEHNDFIIRDISVFSTRFDEEDEYTFQSRAYEVEVSLRDKSVSYFYIINRVCAQSTNHVFIIRYSDNSIELFQSTVTVDYKKEQTLYPYLVPITELEQYIASDKSCMVIGCVEGQLLCLMSGHNREVYDIESEILRSVITNRSFIVE